MAIKDILLSLNTHPDPSPLASVHFAIGLAKRLGARIFCVIWELKLKSPGSVHFADALLHLPALLDEETKRSATHARGLAHAFEHAARREGVFGNSLVQSCAPTEVPDRLSERARLFDLAIVPVVPDDDVARMHAEAAIFDSGRPVMLVPESAFGRDVTLERAVVGWDGSRTAARALADGMDVLEAAAEVHAVTVVNEKSLKAAAGSDELVRHLTAHGIAPRSIVLDAAGRPAGEVLRDYTRSIDAGLLVMGAYGHSRVQQFVMGGATRSMLRYPPVPLLMSH